MIYYGAKELAASARVVRGNTLAVAKDIPEDKYQFKPVPEYRSVTQMLAHIALSYRFQYQLHAVEKRKTLEGFDFPALMKVQMEEENRPRTKAEIIDLLQKEGEKWDTWIEGVSDSFLGEPVQMPAGALPAEPVEIVLSVKEHECIMRQLMLIERLGVVPFDARTPGPHGADE
jgi:hypothetical protein